MKKLINWFKKLKRVVNSYDSQISRIDDRFNLISDHMSYSDEKMAEAVRIIKDRTEINLDISPSMRNPHQIIMIGRYRNRDYVQVFSVHPESFKELIHIVSEMREYGHVSRVDAPAGLQAVVDQEIDYFRL